MTVHEFEQFVLKAKELGLSELTIDGLSFKFASKAQVHTTKYDPMKPPLKPDMCAGCGHHLSGHSGAGCIDCRDYNEACLANSQAAKGAN